MKIMALCNFSIPILFSLFKSKLSPIFSEYYSRAFNEIISKSLAISKSTVGKNSNQFRKNALAQSPLTFEIAE